MSNKAVRTGIAYPGKRAAWWIPLVLLSGAVFFSCQGPLTADREWDVHLPPFYSSASNPAGDSSGFQAFFNLAEYDRTNERTQSRFHPFYYHSREETGDFFTLVPIPFYLDRKNGLDEDTYFLLFGKSKRGYRNDYYPLRPFVRYTDFETLPERWELFLFPLLDLTRDQDRHRLKLIDLSGIMGVFQLLDLQWGVPGKEEEKTGFLFSFFNVLNMVRLMGGGDHGGYNDFQLLSLFSSERLSLYQRHWKKAGGDQGRTVLFPFYWNIQGSEGEAFHLWPFYGWNESPDGKRADHWLYPLFTWESWGGEHEGWAIDCPWPLVRFLRDEGTGMENRIMPFFWDKHYEDGSDLLAVTPLFWQYRNSEGYAFDLLFPLFAHIGFGTEDDTYSLLPLFKLIGDRPREKAAGRREYDLLWPLMGYGTREERTVSWLFPLFSHTRDSDYNQWGFLANLFEYERKGEEKTLTFLWILPVSWGDDEAANASGRDS